MKSPVGWKDIDVTTSASCQDNNKECVEVLWGPVHTTPEEFKNASFFLRSGLPSTLIRHENGAFWKRSSTRRNLKTLAFWHFENEVFRTRWRHVNHVIFLQESSSNTNPNWPRFQISPVWCVQTEDLWCIFKVKTPFSIPPA